LLAHACGEVGIWTPKALGDSARESLDLALEVWIHDELPDGRCRKHLDRAIVVSRAQTAGHDAEVRLETLSQCRAQMFRTIADDGHPRRLEAETGKLCCKKGTVCVAPVAADELAPGDKNDDPWPGHLRQAVETVRTPFAVTTMIAGRLGKFPTWWPFSLAERYTGAPISSQRRFHLRNRCVWPCCSVPS
jgi:hypothetical protein